MEVPGLRFAPLDFKLDHSLATARSRHESFAAAIHNCEASRDVALDITPCLFKSPVRVFRVGRHVRNADGQWRSFRISHFERLDARPLAETVERLRGISRRLGLDRHIVRKLADLRHDPSEAQ